MHRFAVGLREPVAVNDLGLVAYQNPSYVLDLWGLGSQEARKSRQIAGTDPSYLDRLALKHQVKLAMIYEHWFPVTGLPKTWKRIGCLLTPPDWQTVMQGKPVTFLATNTDDVERLSQRLSEFSNDLPSGTRVVLLTGQQRDVGMPNVCDKL
jgi:hypothetical protein